MAVKKSKNPALEVAKAIDEAMTLVGSRLFREARLVLEQAQQVAKNANLGGSAFLNWGLSVCADECQDAVNAVRFITAALKQDPCAPPFINSYKIVRNRVIATFQGMNVNDRQVPTFFRLLVDLDAVDAAACMKFSQHALANGDDAKALALAQDAVHLEPPTLRDCITSHVCLLRLAATRRRALAGVKPRRWRSRSRARPRRREHAQEADRDPRTPCRRGRTGHGRADFTRAARPKHQSDSLTWMKLATAFRHVVHAVGALLVEEVDAVSG